MAQGILGKIKGRLLPPSSRSFHELFAFVVENADAAQRRADSMEETLRERLDGIERRLDQLNRIQDEIEAVDAHLALFSWAALRREGEDAIEAKKRFFREMPAATGGSRLLQLASAQLLKEFDEFCGTHGIDYWLYSGTLLGAVRHGGFIPWDDDVDVGMFRPDVNRLVELTRESERFEATVLFDWYPVCRQVRFRYRNSPAPCFLDVFIFDYTACDAREAFEFMHEERRALVEAARTELVLDAWGPGERQFVSVGNADGDAVAARFDAAVAKGYGAGGCLTSDRSAARGAIWGIDNMDVLTGQKVYYDIDVLVPTRHLPFESLEPACPNDPGVALEKMYGDYFELPSDIKSHFAHIDPELVYSHEVREELHRLAVQLQGNTSGH